MGKEIRVTGLENIQPLSDYPGGTVYRGKRMAEIETIIKILPYPVNISQKDEKSTAYFLKEIKKLKHLNQVPNIHVVKILNTGLTENDSFPFIETERVKGPDLEELLTFPNNAVFRIEEVINLAVQMADALAHTHTAQVKHDRINSNSIRLNPETGSYVLLNFGRVLLTDDQSQAGFNEARAGEYLAPEQRNGEILFETDIYSFGVVLYQTLTGNLPQRKAVKNNTAADNTLVADSPVRKEIIESRKENLPLGWTDNEKEKEMEIPEWLFEVLAVCLEEDPSKRYSNGIKFQEAIKSNLAKEKETTLTGTADIPSKQPEIKKVKASAEKTGSNDESSMGSHTQTLPTNLQANMSKTSMDADEKDVEIKRLRALVLQKDGQLDVYKYQTAEYNPDRNKLNISKPVFYSLLVLLTGLSAFAVYGYFFRKPEPRGIMATYTDTDMTDSSDMVKSELHADSLAGLDTAALINSMPPVSDAKQDIPLGNNNEKKNEPGIKKTILKPVNENKTKKEQTTAKAIPSKKDADPNQEPDNFVHPVNRNIKYTLAVSKAYFYDKPEVTSRRPVYLANSNESELTATKDTNGFIYVVFFNTDREITRGWLRKQDLRQTN